MEQGFPQAKPNSGPAVAPQGQPGTAAQAMIKLQNAGKLINEALPGVPMGSDIHTKLLKLATEFNKLLQDVPQQPGLQATGLMQQARQTSNQAPMAALARLFPQQSQQQPGATPQQPGATPPAS